MISKEKNKLYQHIIDNPLSFEDANELLKIAGLLARKGINVLDLFKKYDSWEYRIVFLHVNGYFDESLIEEWSKLRKVK